MDSKTTWPIVKFLMHATSLRREQAKQLLEEIPTKVHTQLAITAWAWDRDIAASAGRSFVEVMKDHTDVKLATILAAANAATMTKAESDAEETEEAPAARRSMKRRHS